MICGKPAGQVVGVKVSFRRDSGKVKWLQPVKITAIRKIMVPKRGIEPPQEYSH